MKYLLILLMLLLSCSVGSQEDSADDSSSDAKHTSSSDGSLAVELDADSLLSCNAPCIDGTAEAAWSIIAPDALKRTRTCAARSQTPMEQSNQIRVALEYWRRDIRPADGRQQF